MFFGEEKTKERGVTASFFVSKNYLFHQSTCIFKYKCLDLQFTN